MLLRQGTDEDYMATFQAFLGKWMVKYRKLAIANTEQRVSRTTETLSNMRLIKMSAWEPTFMDLILSEVWSG